MLQILAQTLLYDHISHIGHTNNNNKRKQAGAELCQAQAPNGLPAEARIN